MHKPWDCAITLCCNFFPYWTTIAKQLEKRRKREPQNVKVQTASKCGMVYCETLFLNANQAVLLGC